MEPKPTASVLPPLLGRKPHPTGNLVLPEVPPYLSWSLRRTVRQSDPLTCAVNWNHFVAEPVPTIPSRDFSFCTLLCMPFPYKDAPASPQFLRRGSSHPPFWTMVTDFEARQAEPAGCAETWLGVVPRLDWRAWAGVRSYVTGTFQRAHTPTATS